MLNTTAWNIQTRPSLSEWRPLKHRIYGERLHVPVSREKIEAILWHPVPSSSNPIATMILKWICRFLKDTSEIRCRELLYLYQERCGYINDIYKEELTEYACHIHATSLDPWLSAWVIEYARRYCTGQKLFVRQRVGWDTYIPIYPKLDGMHITIYPELEDIYKTRIQNDPNRFKHADGINTIDLGDSTYKWSWRQDGATFTLPAYSPKGIDCGSPEANKEFRDGTFRLEVSMVQRRNSENGMQKDHTSWTIEELTLPDQYGFILGRMIHLDTIDPWGTPFENVQLKHIDLAINVYAPHVVKSRMEWELRSWKVPDASTRTHIFRVDDVPSFFLYWLAREFLESRTLLARWMAQQPTISRVHPSE